MFNDASSEFSNQAIVKNYYNRKGLEKKKERKYEWSASPLLPSFLQRIQKERFSEGIPQIWNKRGKPQAAKRTWHTSVSEGEEKLQEVSWWSSEDGTQCLNFFPLPLCPTVCLSQQEGKKDDWMTPPNLNSDLTTPLKSSVFPPHENTHTRLYYCPQAGERSNYLIILLCSQEIYTVGLYECVCVCVCVCARACVRACIDSDSSGLTG